MRKNKKSAAFCGESGFTLLETMFVLVLFPLLFFSVFATFDAAQVIFRTNNIYGRLNHDAMQTLRYISREIGQTSPNNTPSHLNIGADGNNNSVVRFQIPVDWDNDGDVVTAAMNPAVEWGAYDEAGQTRGCQSAGGDANCAAPAAPNISGRWVRYQVVNNQLQRDVLDGALNPLGGLNKVIANDVLTFTVARANNIVTMNITLRGTDQTGQSGTARNFQTTYTTRTMLRNAVS